MANINVRIDERVKKDAEAVFAEIGMTPTTAINLFYRQVIRTNGIPFSLSASQPNKKTAKAIKEVEKMDRKNEGKTFSGVDELMEDLLR